MLEIFNDINFLVVIYFLGGVPSGLLLSKFMGAPDPRTAGSGNIGATNMLRTGGKKLGAATLFFDALKGILAVYATSIFFPELNE